MVSECQIVSLLRQRGRFLQLRAARLVGKKLATIAATSLTWEKISDIHIVAGAECGCLVLCRVGCGVAQSTTRRLIADGLIERKGDLRERYGDGRIVELSMEGWKNEWNLVCQSTLVESQKVVDGCRRDSKMAELGCWLGFK